MKKKITAIFLCVALVAIAVVGASLAYFTDTDKKVNTFTTGKVDITLNETFNEQTAKLIPATGSAQNGTLKNGIEKKITVTNNTGSEDAWVRLHIAFPADTFYYSDVDGVQEYNNLVHFNQSGASLKVGEWNWTPTKDGSNNTTMPGYPGNGKGYNLYKTKIDNKDYIVFVVTYMTKLSANETTKTEAMHTVYLDKYANTEDGKTFTAPANVDYRKAAMTGDLSNYKIYVVAEGVQAAGFDDPYTALNEAFGTPGSEGYVAPTFVTVVTGE